MAYLILSFGGESAYFAPGTPLLAPFGGKSACFAPGTLLFAPFGGESACFAPFLLPSVWFSYDFRHFFD